MRPWAAEARQIIRQLLCVGVSNYWDPRFSYTCEPYQDAAYTGSNLATDPGCDGTVLWTPRNSATLSNPAGHTGVCLQAVRNGVNGPGALQNAAIAANARYRASAWIACVGGTTSYMYVGANPIAAATAGGWTQHVNNNVFSGASTSYYSGCNLATVDGMGVQIDDLVLVRQPVVSQAGGLIGPSNLVQAGGLSKQPTYLPIAAVPAHGLTCPCWLFDGGAQAWIGPAANAASGAIFGWYNRSANLAAAGDLWGAVDGAGPVRCRAQIGAGALPPWNLYLGSSTIATGVASPLSAWQFVSVAWNAGAYVWRIGGVTGNGAYADNVPATAIGFMSYASASLYNVGYVASLGCSTNPLTLDALSAIEAITRPQGV